MTDKIKIGVADDHEVAIDVNKLVDSRMLIQGNSGGGKSYLLRLLCERAAGLVPIIILDAEGEYATLREKVDAILIGPDGEVPTDLRSAAILPRKLIELQVSAIIDLYELKPQDRREYVRQFLDALINLPKDLWHPTLIVIDEIHKFAPEKGQGDAVSTQSVINLASLGRKRGYALIGATQRFSKLHNDVIAETNNVCIGRTWMDADQLRAGKYLGLSATERTVLRDLKPGTFYSFGPAFNINGVFQFKGDKVVTSHPKPGERYKTKPTKPSDAIQQIVSQIEDLPEVAEAEARTLKEVQEQARRRETEFKTQINALERELKESAKPVIQDKMVFPDEKLAELQAAIDTYYGGFSRMIDHVTSSEDRIERLVMDLRKAIPTDETLVDAEWIEPPVTGHRNISEYTVPAGVAETIKEFRQTPVRTIEAFSGSLPEGEQKILTAIAQYSDRGGIDREQASILTGYKQSTRNAYIQRLLAKGLVTILGGTLLATPDGVAALGDFEPLPTGDALRAYWYERLPEGEAGILRLLCDHYPAAVDRNFISDQTGYKQSTRNAYLQRLGVKKLVNTNSGGVQASAVLFG